MKHNFRNVVYKFEFLHLQECEVSMETVQPLSGALDCLPTQVKMQTVLDASSISCALNIRQFEQEIGS